MTNIRKAILAIVITIITILSIQSSCYATQSATVIKEDIKLRKEMDDKSTILELIPKDEEIEVVQKEQGDWYQVRYLKIRGYVRSDEITVKNGTSENTQEKKEPETTKEEQTPTDIPEDTPLTSGDIAVAKQETKLQIRPLLNSISVTTVTPDKEIVLVQIINGWAYVSTDTAMGWVRLNTLSRKQDKVTTTPMVEDNKIGQDTKKEETKTTKTGYISSEDVNFRKEANTTSTILKVFTKNTKVTILEQQEEWVKIQYNGKTGYVSKEYISDTKIETTSRGNSEQRTQNQNETTNTITKGQEIAAYATQFLGSRYVYGGETPTKGFDCSGFTKYIFKQFGVNLTHSATAQSKIGTKVEKSELQVGDIVFFSDYKTYQGIGHCGIYMGDNMFIHASTESVGVTTSSLLKGSYVKRYVTATRVI